MEKSKVVAYLGLLAVGKGCVDCNKTPSRSSCLMNAIALLQSI